MKTPRQNPRVGIWWRVGKSLVAFYDDVEQVLAVHDVRDSDLAHVDVWQQVVHRFPKLRGTEYDSIPRGRVLQHGDVFHILLPKALACDQEFISKILARFRLPLLRYRVIVDEHYNPPHEIDWDD